MSTAIRNLLISVTIATVCMLPPGLAAADNRAAAGNATMQDDRPTAEQMIVDGLVLRPLALAGTIVGTAIFIVTLPFSLPGGNADEAARELIAEPARATFGTCLGCITDYTGSRSSRRQ